MSLHPPSRPPHPDLQPVVDRIWLVNRSGSDNGRDEILKCMSQKQFSSSRKVPNSPTHVIMAYAAYVSLPRRQAKEMKHQSYTWVVYWNSRDMFHPSSPPCKGEYRGISSGAQLVRDIQCGKKLGLVEGNVDVMEGCIINGYLYNDDDCKWIMLHGVG